MKNKNDEVIEHIDGVDVAFADYIPSLTGEVQPQASKKKKKTEPPPPQTKQIELKMTEMSSGDVITLPNIARYEEAIPSAVKWANIP
jgi:hypothetical protein